MCHSNSREIAVKQFDNCYYEETKNIIENNEKQEIAMPSSRGPSQPRDRTQVSHIAGYPSPSQSTGKPMNIGVGSLSLLQGIFPIQESNQGLLHCRWILYQLSY